MYDDGKDNQDLKEAYTGDGKIINSDFLNNLKVKDAKQRDNRENSKKEFW